MKTDISQLIPGGFGDVQLSTMFSEEETKRSHLTSNWERYAGYTLPYVYTMDGHTEDLELQHDYQSAGAKAVNSLNNKLVNTLFAPTKPFFRIELNEEMQAQAVAAGIQQEDLEEVTSQTEKAAMKEMDKVGGRTAILSAVKSLIITGNSLMYFPEQGDNNVQVYSLKDYVVRRDLSGNVIAIITRDNKSVNSLPDGLAAQVRAAGITEPDHEVIIYTGIFRVADGRFVVKQEVDDLFVIPNQKGIYTKDTLPWIPLTWNLNRGHEYGTGLVEEYAGSFASLSNLAESMHNLVAIASDIKGLVDPMGSTDIATLNDSPPGTWCYGNREDVDYLQLEKLQDLKFITEEMAGIKREIGEAFLVASAGQRDAERVTATEIERNAYELEESLGGIYSRLAEELQRPIAQRLLTQLSSELSNLEVTVLTGMDALSRKSEIESMRMLFEDLSTLNALDEETRAMIKLSPLIQMFAAHRQVDYKTFVKSEEERAAELEAEAQREQQMIEAEQAAKNQPMM